MDVADLADTHRLVERSERVVLLLHVGVLQGLLHIGHGVQRVMIPAVPGTVRPVDDERDGLLAYLEQQRLVLRLTAYGLTDEQARLAPTVSALTVGGLVKHSADVERAWMAYIQQRERDRGGDEDYGAAFRLGPDETIAGVLDDYAAAADETERGDHGDPRSLAARARPPRRADGSPPTSRHGRCAG